MQNSVEYSLSMQIEQEINHELVSGEITDLTAQQVHEQLICEPRSPSGLYKATKLSQTRIYEALAIVVGENWKDVLPTFTARSGIQGNTMSPDVQEEVLNYHQTPFLAEIPYLHQEGWQTIQQIGASEGLPLSTVRLYADEVCADWQSESLMIPSGKRRVYLMPPRVVEDVKQYASFSDHRMYLANWRSVHAREVSPFELPVSDRSVEYSAYGLWFDLHVEHERRLNIFLFQPGEVELSADIDTLCRSNNRGFLAGEILDNKTLFSVSDEEIDWLTAYRREGRRAYAELAMDNMEYAKDLGEQFYFDYIALHGEYSVVLPEIQTEAVYALLCAVRSYKSVENANSFEAYIKESIIEALFDHVYGEKEDL